jgi:hypothetical protein
MPETLWQGIFDKLNQQQASYGVAPGTVVLVVSIADNPGRVLYREKSGLPVDINHAGWNAG